MQKFRCLGADQVTHMAAPPRPNPPQVKRGQIEIDIFMDTEINSIYGAIIPSMVELAGDGTAFFTVWRHVIYAAK